VDDVPHVGRQVNGAQRPNESAKQLAHYDQ
jgi:hypothetical protein